VRLYAASEKKPFGSKKIKGEKKAISGIGAAKAI